MDPINETEVLLQYIANQSGLSPEEKQAKIAQYATPDPAENYDAANPCKTCGPPPARQEFIRSLSPRFVLTIYTAYAGTPLNDSETGEPKILDDGKRDTSAAGHMWYSIVELGKKEQSYGFAPIDTGMTGPGYVSIHDIDHYENPYYRRKMEITQDQYDCLLEFGKEGVANRETYFSLYYNGATNSCIDFTWQALRHAGLNATVAKNHETGRSIRNKNKGTFDGSLKVIDNIPDIQSIPAPFLDSELNTEIYNEKPSRTAKQWLLSNNEENRGDDELGIVYS